MCAAIAKPDTEPNRTSLRCRPRWRILGADRRPRAPSRALPVLRIPRAAQADAASGEPLSSDTSGRSTRTDAEMLHGPIVPFGQVVPLVVLPSTVGPYWKITG